MSLSPCNRPDCPRGGGGVQRLPALACCQPPLGRAELRQDEGHGGDERRPLLAAPQDTLAASGHLWTRRPRPRHPAGAAAVDLPLFGAVLPRPGSPGQPEPGRGLRRGRHSGNVGVTPGTYMNRTSGGLRSSKAGAGTLRGPGGVPGVPSNR